jgi:hypothetical protein
VIAIARQACLVAFAATLCVSACDPRREPGLRELDLATLRERSVDRPPRAFEHFNPGQQSAEEILEHGWSLLDLPAVEMVPPIDWHAHEDTNRSWSFHLNAWQPLAALLARHSSTGDRRFLDPAVAVAEDWLRANPPLYAAPIVEQFQWYDMAVGLRTHMLAYMVDVVRRDTTFPDARLRALWLGLLDHLDYLADDDNIRFHNNHGFFQAAGQLAAGRRFEWLAELAAVAAQGEARLQRMMAQQFARDGVHREHSPGYQMMVVHDWWRLRGSGLLDDGWSAPLTANLETALAWMIAPDGNLAQLGDTDRGDIPARLRTQPLASPVLAYVASGGTEGAPPTDDVAAFRDGGLLVMRTWPGPAESLAAQSYLASQCAFHSRTHKHADDLTILWYDRGRPVLIDAGRYGYLGKTTPGSDLHEQGFWYSDPRRVFVESTAAHNTVEIDGRSQDRKYRTPFGSGLLYGGVQHGLQVGHCRAPQAGGVVHTRVVVTRPGHWLLVIDHLATSETASSRAAPRSYRQWFHFAPELTVTAHGSQLAISGLPAPLIATSLLGGVAWSAPLRGQEDPLQGWWSPEGGVFEPATASALARTAADPETTFATLFVFADEVTPDPAFNQFRDGAAQLRWQADGVATTIRISGIDGAQPTVHVQRP